MIKKLPEAPKSPVKFWALVIGIPIALILVVVGMFLYQGSSKEIESIADQFNPGVGWLLEEEHIEPPRVICLNDVPCPSVAQSWIGKNRIDENILGRVLQEYKSIDGHAEGCTISNINKGGTCSIDAVSKGYVVQAYLENVSNSSSESASVYKIFIRKR